MTQTNQLANKTFIDIYKKYKGIYSQNDVEKIVKDQLTTLITEIDEQVIGPDTVVASHQCGGDFTTMCVQCQSEVKRNNFRKHQRQALSNLKQKYGL
jgi:hypothetical protein